VRRRVIPRPATPKPRIIRRRSSDPNMRAPNRIEHREYFDGPSSVVEERTEVIRPPLPPPRPPSRSLAVVSASGRSSASRRHVSESDESDYTTQEGRRRRYHDDSRARGRSRNFSRGHRRQRSRHSGTADEGELQSIERAGLSA
jgi:hypothetical protein